MIPEQDIHAQHEITQPTPLLDEQGGLARNDKGDLVGARKGFRGYGAASAE
ncbi:MAG TPA: hypothetical protein G4N98_08080 [Thermoflexia bacterium]|nr:hypothetical protein [Thermoflexia bacterium]